jgi:hypothetical protein
MAGENEDLFTFLERFGFSEVELQSVSYELEAYRSIPGTTLGRYLNRIINSLIDEDRSAFLKGIMVGVAIRKAVDAMEEPELTEEEKRTLQEIEKIKSGER